MELIDYQDRRHASAYVSRGLDVAEREQALAPSAAMPVTVTFARHPFKLMAYKDEYEVARLHLNNIEQALLANEFGPNVTARIMLHPAALKALGLKGKIHLGVATGLALRLLRCARRLRGTSFDPFGRTAVRRTERALITEYCELIDVALDGLRPATVARIVDIASLPDLIRGYEEIKEARVDRYRERARSLLANL